MSPSARSRAIAPNDTHPHPALRATFPIPFVPSGHFPLTRGIGPLEGGRLNTFPRNRSKLFGVPLIPPFGGTFPQGKANS